ncbi:MAG: D-glycero-beta-D-manno-heptose-7-phosphate kinase [Alphaproteobacteria bacterium]|nr:D-glycero-beta-D-manno-heptose-7-phosphate kinase [Alphaproteobacteria bacterium]
MTTRSSPANLDIARLQGVRVLCVGDVMLDHYVYGQVDRVSPEAPIPVLRVERETRSLGGAGNVLRNLQALGARGCLLSVLGNDAAGGEVSRLVAELGETESHLLVETGRQTTVKTRYIGANQQMLRADRESAAPLGAHVRADLARLVEHALAEHAILVLSDYAKGVLGDGVAAALIAAARRAGKPVIVDPKGTLYAPYSGASLLKPNRRELALATGLPVGTEDEIIAAARGLIASGGLDAVLVSLSQDGMILIEAKGGVHRLEAAAREVFDVSGAGDTVVATLAAALAAGMSRYEAAHLANVAAGIVVAKVGTAVAHGAEIAAMLAHGAETLDGKIQPLVFALERIERWRRRGLKIGFTNGCFDLLHPGHVSLIEQSRGACDRLIVGLNSDESVRRLKGDGRPVQNEAARAQVLASLASVDLVVTFAEDTPAEIIAAVRPDILVKGADYRLEEVVGAELVQSWGGKVVLAELKPGHSTTATIRRIGAG